MCAGKIFPETFYLCKAIYKYCVGASFCSPLSQRLCSRGEEQNKYCKIVTMCWKTAKNICAVFWSLCGSGKNVFIYFSQWSLVEPLVEQQNFYNQAAAHLRASILFIFTLEIFLFLYPLSDLWRAISVLHLALTRLCWVCHLMATWQGMVRVQV